MKIKSMPFFLALRINLLILLGIFSASCSSNREADYLGYDKLPSIPVSGAMRSILKSIPYTRERAFYGNYGGSGCLGGVPTDEMDEYFRRHDVVYAVARSRRTMRIADGELVKVLKKIDDKSLSDEGLVYRDRAIKFMESYAAGVVGKPLAASFWSQEPSGSYFRDPNAVRRFFGNHHPGLPDPDVVETQRLSMQVGTRISESSRVTFDE